MDINSAFLSFEITYHSQTALDGRVIASNGRFAGFSNFYTHPEGKDLIEFANRLRGFPRQSGQVEEFWFGIFYSQPISLIKTDLDPGTFEAFIGLRFFCIDGFGHPAVRIDFIQEPEYWMRPQESRGRATFEMRFYPAQLDEFVPELLALGENKEGRAILKGID